MKIDYYAPRTTGNGRMFFQRHIRWQDWILTYFEAIIFLSSIYKKIDIIGFSTGCNVAVYLSSIYWNDIINFDSACKINNLILLSPNFISNPNHITYKKCMKNKVFYKLLAFLYPISLKPLPDKKTKCEIDIEYKKDLDKIYYERSILIESLKEVWNFCDTIPDAIDINKKYMIYGYNDNVVGNFKKQKKLLESIHNKKTDNYIGNINCFKLVNAKHNILNEHPLIRYTLFSKIKELLFKN
jgi:esterase/lipase